MSCGSLRRMLLDDAIGLDELAPVDGAQAAEAADAVADRDLIRCLLLVFELHQLFDRQMRFRKPLFNPRQCEGQAGAVSLQSACKFRHERAAHGRRRSRHVGDDEDETLRLPLSGLHHSIGPGIGQIAFDYAGGNAYAHATKILDQRETKHDRNSPELAQLQRGNRLVGSHEAIEAVGVDPTVAVRDRFERDVVHARQTRREAQRQARQLPAVAPGQVPFGRADLLFDQMEVIEQPLAGGADPLVRRHRLRQSARKRRSIRFRLRPTVSATGPACVEGTADVRRPASCRIAPSGRY